MAIKSMTNHNLNHSRERRKGHTMVGITIATIGFFWFANKIGWIPVIAGGSSIFWPAVTIAVGVVVCLSGRRQRKRAEA